MPDELVLLACIGFEQARYVRQLARCEGGVQVRQYLTCLLLLFFEGFADVRKLNVCIFVGQVSHTTFRGRHLCDNPQ